VAPKLVSLCRRNRCQVSVVRMWQIASRRRLLHIAQRPHGSYGVQNNRKSVGLKCQPDLWIVAALLLGGYGLPSLQSRSCDQWHPSVVLNGCGTWFFILREGYRLKIRENMVLTKIFVHQDAWSVRRMEKIAQGETSWFDFSPNELVFRVMKNNEIGGGFDTHERKKHVVLYSWET
jgi:hypothetical protein